MRDLLMLAIGAAGMGMIWLVVQVARKVADRAIDASLDAASERFKRKLKATVEIKPRDRDGGKVFQFTAHIENHSGREIRISHVNLFLPTQVYESSTDVPPEKREWKTRGHPMKFKSQATGFVVPKDSNLHPVHEYWSPGSRQKLEMIPESEYRIEVETPNAKYVVVDGAQIREKLLALAGVLD